MSRIRRVGGNITKTTGGVHSMYSGGDMTFSSYGKITETADEGIFYGEPDPLPARELKAQLAVHFRPCKDWKGEYGFDWMRKGDLVHIHGKSVFGDVDYRKLITKQYVKGTQILEMGDNVYVGDFKQDSSSYNAMRNTQDLYAIPWRKMKDEMLQDVLLPSSGAPQPEDYFVPWLSLFPGATAKLSLLIDVEAAATKLIFKYDKECFKLSTDEIDGKPYNKQQFPHGLADVISIECLKEFSQDQKIEVYANNKDLRQNLVGELRVWANDTSKRKKLKVVFVDVRLPLISDKESLKIEEVKKQEGYLKKYFGQALIETEVLEIIELNLTNDPYLRKEGTGVKDGMLLESFVGEGGMTTFIINYLQEKLEEEHKEVDKEAYVVFYISEQGAIVVNSGQVALKDAKLQRIDGVANKGNKAQVLFRANELDDWTTSHEIMHSLGLAHSFTNKEADSNALYTFKAQSTENIMDYSLWECYSLWKWQWEIINKNL